jgi:hypothetical protein
VASGLKDRKLAEERTQVEDQGDRDALACFNARAPKQSFFAGLTKEAQSLVDRLAPSTEAQQQPVGGGTVLPHDAASREAPPGISPGLIQSWKDYINDYPQRLAEFQKDQAARRKAAKEVDFSEVKNMDDAEKSAPFLHEKVQELRTDQKENMENIKANPDKTFPDPSVSIEIAESRGKINLLFVMSNGMLYCGTGGCGTDVYADEGAGYKKAFDALTFGPVYVTRTGGQVFLYLANPNVISSHFSLVDNALPTEFILKDGQFVENKPPPREPDSPPPAGFAATVTTTSPSTFAADTKGVVNGNFSDVPTLLSWTNGGSYSAYNPLSGYASLQGVSFSTTNLGGNVNVGSAYLYGPNDLPKPYATNSVYSGTAPDILTITLPMAATAFYLDFTTLFVSTIATFDLSNGFSTTVSPTVAYPGTPEFLGFLSNVPFTTITLTVPSQQSWVVADFGYGIATATSPAPRVRHYENVDASGNDRGSWVRGVSSADCESICIADSGCAGYTYNRLRATCIPKNTVVRLMSSTEAAVTGVVEGR